MSIFWIEGVDRSGKSTLAAKLAVSTFSKVIHCSKPKTDDPFMEYVDMITNIPDNEAVVFDRGFLGEFVYANLWRGGCKITPREFKVLDKIAKAKKSVVIHAYADTKDIIERCRREGEDLLKEDQIDTCKALFVDIISRTSLPVFKYNSSMISPDDFIRAMLIEVRDFGL